MFQTPSPYSNEANGRPAKYSKTGASASTRSELLSIFHTQLERGRQSSEQSIPPSNGSSRRLSSGGVIASHTGRASTGSMPQTTGGSYRDIHPREDYSHNGHASTFSDSTPKAMSSHFNKFPQNPNPSTYGDNISVHAFSVPPSSASAGVIKEIKNENDGPHRAEMISRMEASKRGDRLLPPCDRCRRLHMDCIKNLTACAGCTKKHAKCSWRDVIESELWGPDKGKVPIPQTAMEMDGVRDREREPSVGARPDHASVQLLQALSEHHSPNAHPDANGAFAANARTLAMEGLAAEQHAHATTASNGIGNGHGDYHGPKTPQALQTSFPPRPPSSGAQSIYQNPPPQLYHSTYEPQMARQNPTPPSASEEMTVERHSTR